MTQNLGICLDELIRNYLNPVTLEVLHIERTIF